MPRSKKKILVTGAFGFTGRHLGRDLSSDSSVSLHLASSATVSGRGQHQCNLLDRSEVCNLISYIRPDRIYHLVGSYTNDYEKDYGSNVLTILHILDAVRATNTRSRILLVGSSAEYGFPLEEDAAVTEDHPCKPVSIYGLVKLFQTELMETYIRLYDMDLVAVRPFNLLGKDMSPALFVGKLEQEIERYKRGEIKTIDTGDLSVERDYIDIHEAIKYYRKVMEKGKTGEIYNVGSGKSISLRDIVSRMLSAEGISMDIVHEGVHQVAGKIVVPKIFADTTKIRAL